MKTTKEDILLASLKLFAERGFEAVSTSMIASEIGITGEIKKGNNESVSRLTDICRTLPVFEMYCSDAIKPKIDLLAAYVKRKTDKRWLL